MSSSHNPPVITDEEVAQFENTYTSHIGNITSCYKAALADFLNRRPELKLGRLRPIAEMSEKPPAGCVRTYYRMQHGDMALAVESTAEYFSESLLPTPDPEAEERQRFEEAMKRAFPHFTFKFHENGSGEYANPHCETSWTAWKLAKAK